MPPPKRGLLMLSSRGLTCRLIVAGFVSTVLLYRLNSLSISFSTSSFVMFIGSTISLILLSVSKPSGTMLDRALACFDMLNLLSISSLIGGLSSYGFAALSVGWRDQELMAADRLLGLNWLTYWNFIQTNPLIDAFLNIGYQSIFITPTISVIILAATGTIAHAYRFIAAFVVALFTTDVLLAIIPGKSAAALLLSAGPPHAPASGLMHIPIIEHLRAGTFGPVDVGHLDGLIAFPSFHSAAAVLFAFAAWPVRWIRIPSLLLNALMLAATPIQGGHYFADTIGGICVALGAIAITSCLPSPRLAVTPSPIISEEEERIDAGAGQSSSAPIPVLS